ncbi:MAG: hypothetical protein GX799_02685 [Crenarchaeota archaeon]|jgi:hypothetical protein|nr:hypothetical protein [Thermoproteota archaeon]
MLYINNNNFGTGTQNCTNVGLYNTLLKENNCPIEAYNTHLIFENSNVSVSGIAIIS